MIVPRGTKKLSVIRFAESFLLVNIIRINLNLIIIQCE